MSASISKCTQAGPPTYVCSLKYQYQYVGTATLTQLPGTYFPWPTQATVLNSCSNRRLYRNEECAENISASLFPKQSTHACLRHGQRPQRLTFPAMIYLERVYELFKHIASLKPPIFYYSLYTSRRLCCIISHEKLMHENPLLIYMHLLTFRNNDFIFQLLSLFLIHD